MKLELPVSVGPWPCISAEAQETRALQKNVHVIRLGSWLKNVIWSSRSSVIEPEILSSQNQAWSYPRQLILGPLFWVGSKECLLFCFSLNNRTPGHSLQLAPLTSWFLSPGERGRSLALFLEDTPTPSAFCYPWCGGLSSPCSLMTFPHRWNPSGYELREPPTPCSAVPCLAWQILPLLMLVWVSNYMPAPASPWQLWTSAPSPPTHHLPSSELLQSRGHRVVSREAQRCKVTSTKGLPPTFPALDPQRGLGRDWGWGPTLDIQESHPGSWKLRAAWASPNCNMSSWGTWGGQRPSDIYDQWRKEGNSGPLASRMKFFPFPVFISSIKTNPNLQIKCIWIWKFS